MSDPEYRHEVERGCSYGRVLRRYVRDLVQIELVELLH